MADRTVRWAVAALAAATLTACAPPPDGPLPCPPERCIVNAR